MTSTNSDEIKSVSHTTDSELQIRNEQIQNFIYFLLFMSKIKNKKIYIIKLVLRKQLVKKNTK